MGITLGEIVSEFSRGPDDWVSEELGSPSQDKTVFNAYKKLIGIKAFSNKAYFVAPPKFLGDQRASYNQKLKFRLKISASDLGPRPSLDDIVITGGLEDMPKQISIPINGQGNPMPSGELQTYEFRLNEHSFSGWLPQLTTSEFFHLFSNVLSIKIRGSYTTGGEGFIDNVQLESAERGYLGQPAKWLEECDCPTGYSGQFCQSCSAG